MLCNITERKQAEAALHQAHVELANINRILEQRVATYEERQRLSRDLQDSVTQSLYGLVTLSEAGPAQLESSALESIGYTLATSVTVYLRRSETAITLEIIDNGCGFIPEKVMNRGRGLTNMRECACKTGCASEITPIIGQGTCVRVTASLAAVSFRS